MIRYYVGEYVTDKADSEFVMPYNSVHIGVAEERHVIMSNMHFDNGRIDIYESLQDAWNACKKICQLQTLVINDNMSDDDVRYISDDINNTPGLFNFKRSGDDNSFRCKKQSYIDIMSKMAMCRLNRLNVDFSQAASYPGYISYKEFLDEMDMGDESGSDRSAVFEDQAVSQKKHSIMFVNDQISLIVDPCINKKQADYIRDDLYRNIAKSYGQKYVSLSEISDEQLSDFEQILDEKGNATDIRLYHFIRDDKEYDISVDVSKANSVRMQIAMYLSDQYNHKEEKPVEEVKTRDLDLIQDDLDLSRETVDNQLNI